MNTKYTGPEIEGFFIFSMYFTNLWAIMAYSGGMPVLYPIAVINFFFLYWIYKILIIKTYRKTSNFNQELPLNTIWMYKLALFFHICLSVLMFSYKNLMNLDVKEHWALKYANEYVEDF